MQVQGVAPEMDGVEMLVMRPLVAGDARIGVFPC